MRLTCNLAKNMTIIIYYSLTLCFAFCYRTAPALCQVTVLVCSLRLAEVAGDLSFLRPLQLGWAGLVMEGEGDLRMNNTQVLYLSDVNG